MYVSADQTVGYNYTSAADAHNQQVMIVHLLLVLVIQLKLTMRQVSLLRRPGITRREDAAEKKKRFFVTSGNTSFTRPSVPNR